MKHLLLPISIGVLILTACGSGSGKPEGCQTSSISFAGETSDKLNSKSTENYTYDGEGRLTRTEYSSQKPSSSYTYLKDKIKTSSEKTGDLEYTLNDKGMIIKAEKPGTPYVLEIKYNKDENISDLVLDAKNHTTFSYVGSTLTKIEDTADKKITTYEISVGQDSIKNNFLVGSIYFDMFALVSYQSHFMSKIYRDVLGKMAAHQGGIRNTSITAVKVSSTDKSLNGQITYEYQKDATGNVTSAIEMYKTATGIWRKFEYKVNYKCE